MKFLHKDGIDEKLFNDIHYTKHKNFGYKV